MAKELWGEYFQFPRIFWLRTRSGNANGDFVKQGKGYNLSVYAKWTFVTLKELENAFTGREKSKEEILYDGIKDPKEWFYYENGRLAEQAGMSISQLKRAKAELIKSGLISTCRVFFIDSHGKKSLHYTTGYKIHDRQRWDLEPYQSKNKSE